MKTVKPGPIPRPGAAPAVRAFTLAEVAMAVLVLAFTLTSALTVMQRAFLQFDTARNLEVAANILQCEMEKERLFTWAQAGNTGYAPVIDMSFARNPAIGGRFTLSRTVATLAGHSSQVLQITLTVSWRGYDGRSLTRNYTSYYTQGGLYAYLYNP
jgi:Tfp pilus assembly protein PilV